MENSEENFKVFDVEKPWGNFRQFNLNSPSTVKILTVNAGEVLSLQTHAKRSEFWRIISGEGIVTIGDKNYTAIVGEEYEIPVGERHRLSAGPDGIVVLEISYGFFDEEDITRLEDKYGRINS